MYKVNDTVLYGTHGVCKITDITEKTFDGKTIEYYVLKPVYDEKSTIFVPVNNKALATKMHSVLSPDEIYDLIKTMPEENPIWIENEAVRKERYKEIITAGDRRELVILIKTLFLHQQKQKESGKKLHVTDERFFNDAEKMLYEEIAHVLNIKPEQVLPLIFEQVQIEEKQ